MKVNFRHECDVGARAITTRRSVGAGAVFNVWSDGLCQRHLGSVLTVPTNCDESSAMTASCQANSRISSEPLRVFGSGVLAARRCVCVRKRSWQLNTRMSYPHRLITDGTCSCNQQLLSNFLIKIFRGFYCGRIIQ